MTPTRSEQERLLRLLEEKKITENDFQLLSKSLRSKPFQWNWLLFPFLKISGLPATLLALLVAVAMSALAWKGQIYFPGLFDLQKNGQSNFLNLFGQNLVIWLIASLIFFAFAKLSGQKSLQISDFINAFGLSRIAYLFGTAVLPLLPNIDTSIPPEQLLSAQPGTIIATSVIALLSVVWLIAAYYQAYKLASGLQKKKLVWTFIAALLVGEILSAVIIRSYLL